MTQVMKKEHIQEHELNEEHYFQSLLIKATQRGMFTSEQLAKIQMGLYELIKNQVFKFTSGESTSVKIETAHSLMQSIYFSIGAYLKTVKDMDKKIHILTQENIQDIFLKSKDILKKYLLESHAKLKLIQSEYIDIGNMALHETLFDGFPGFFLEYDVNFKAHEIPGGIIDYILSVDFSHLVGVEYVQAYLNCLIQENHFCRCFSAKEIEKLLRGYSKTYKEDLINVYEIVLGNAIGRIISENDLSSLSITNSDRNIIKRKLVNMGISGIDKYLFTIYEQLLFELKLSKQETDYVYSALNTFCKRTRTCLENDSLEAVFISFREEVNKPQAYYFDGNQMDNDKLRELIEELNQCRYLSDKILLITSNVKSLNDLTEILSECIYEGEYEHVFHMMTKEEISLLKERILYEKESEVMPLIEYDGWKAALICYSEK